MTITEQFLRGKKIVEDFVAMGPPCNNQDEPECCPSMLLMGKHAVQCPFARAQEWLKEFP